MRTILLIALLSLALVQILPLHAQTPQAADQTGTSVNPWTGTSIPIPTTTDHAGTGTSVNPWTGTTLIPTGTEPQQNPVPQPAPSIERDPNYMKFKGNGLPFSGLNPAHFPALLNSILGYQGVTFTLPDYAGKPQCFVELTGMDRLVTGHEFEQLMIHAVSPSDQSQNKYVVQTSASMKQLEQMILSSPGNLTPADVMTMSLRACGGNFPLAALTGHNLLKEIAYGGRAEYTKLAELITRGRPLSFPARYGNFAAKLVNLRKASGDKMGVWYHSFVPLAIIAWTNVPQAGDNAIIDEYLVRKVGGWTNMGSPVDPEKQASDEQFAKVMHQVHKLYSLQIPKLKVCNAELTPTKGPVDTEFKLDLSYQVSDAPQPVAVKELINVSGPVGAVVSSSSRSIIRSTRDSKRDFQYKGLKEGKYKFEIALSVGTFKKDINIPFEVTAKPTASSYKRAPVVVFDNHKSPEVTYEVGNNYVIQRYKGYSRTLVTRIDFQIPEILEVGKKVTLQLSVPDQCPIIVDFSATDCCPVGQTCDASSGEWDRFSNDFRPRKSDAPHNSMASKTSYAIPSSSGVKLLAPSFVFKPPANATPEIMMHVDQAYDGVVLRWKYAAMPPTKL